MMREMTHDCRALKIPMFHASLQLAETTEIISTGRPPIFGRQRAPQEVAARNLMAGKKLETAATPAS
jgi:hypothetical protein